MKVSTKLSRNNALAIIFDGELDQSVAEKIRKELDEYLDKVSPSCVIFDMQKLSFMDSTGIGLIMGRYKKIKAKNIPVYIGNPNKQIDKVLLISGLYSIIPPLR